MFPIFTLFVIFVIALNVALRRQDRTQTKADQDFWARELAANNTRKQDISKLDYLYVPLDKIPQNLHTDAEKALVDLSSKKMLNLFGQSNTDLKLQYGVSNLDELSSYEENFARYVAVLPEYAAELIDAGQPEDATALLELAVEQRADSCPVYTILADLYIKAGQPEKVQPLIEKAKGFDSMSGRIIVDKLNEALAANI